jgi:hypothetical protein
MNELLSDTRFWLITLGTVIVGLVKYLLRGHAERLENLEMDAVRRKEFDQLRADLKDEHEQNSGRLDRIESGITGTHKRLDDLYRDLIGMGGQR